MNEDELRKSLLKENLAKEYPELRQQEDLLAEAKAIRAKFDGIRDPEEKRGLMERYEEIDRELEALKVAETHGGGYVARGPRALTKGELARAKELSAIEKGRRRVVEKGRAGAGENTFTRIKSELNYLLNNYSPTNDYKIETLIDKWRTSGDPAYDPAIKLRLRNVRRKKSQSDTAL